tara:strand:- start:96 stop:548 length:453 start_codon:yes stop_codon:yes gene_type:complete
MIKKIFIIIIFTLFWNNSVLANVLDLYCEYVEGKATEKGEIQHLPITDYSVGDRFSDYLKGYKIKINISKQKIIEAPEYNEDDEWKTIFSEDEILWYRSAYDSDGGASDHFILNRYTGILREEGRIITGNRKNDTFVVLIFKCSKAKRLF